jgi:acyl-CoA thioesterase
MTSLYSTLELEQTAENTYRAQNDSHGAGVVFGGQLLAQAVVASLQGEADKRVKTLHTVFARAGRVDEPLEISVQTVSSGRAFGSKVISFAQGGRLFCTATALLTAYEDDFIRHADDFPAGVPDPESSKPMSHGDGPWQLRVPNDVDVNDPSLVGPPDYLLWGRFEGAPTSPIAQQGLLAYTTESFLIASAMRPHADVGQSQAHVTLSTAVMSHTISFHENADVSQWLLLENHSTASGHGRANGRGNVFTQDGTLVASYFQDCMIRKMAEGSHKL